jgi:hypothetical protein
MAQPSHARKNSAQAPPPPKSAMAKFVAAQSKRAHVQGRGAPSPSQGFVGAPARQAVDPEFLAWKEEKRKAKEPKKEKEKNWWDHVKEWGTWGLKKAVQIAPHVLPFLLATHPPTIAAAAAYAAKSPLNAARLAAVPKYTPQTFATPQLGAPSTGPAPIAVGDDGMMSQVGVHAMHTKAGSNGRISSMRVSGTDFIGPVLIAASPAAGLVDFESVISPVEGCLSTTRTGNFGVNFEKYKIHSASLVYAPLVPTTQPGGTCLFFDIDPVDASWGTGATAVQRGSSHEGADGGAVWESHICHLPVDPEAPPLYINPDGTDARLAYAARIAVMESAPVTGTAGTSYANLYVVWDIEYIGAALDPIASQGGSAIVKIQAQNSTGAAGQSATTPFGTNDPLTVGTMLDSNSNLPLQSQPTSSQNWQFYGLSPGKFVTVVYVVGTGISAINPVTTGVWNVVQLTQIASAAATSAVYVGEATVGADNSSPQSGTISFTATATTVTIVVWYLIAVPTALSKRFKRLKTLQDYEKRVELLSGLVAGLMGNVPPPPLPPMLPLSLPLRVPTSSLSM